MNMQESLEYIQHNLLGIGGLLIGTIGVILSIYFYRKPVRIKKPLYTTTSFNFINNNLPEISNLEIKYLNKEIKNLTATKIAVWNGGKETINKIDVPENAPLIIKAKENIQIYSAELSYSSEISNQIKLLLVEDLNEVLIEFEYLDYADGGIVKILHSGDSSSDLIVEGRVKGAGKFEEANDFNRNEQPLYFFLFLLFPSVIGLIFGGVTITRISLAIIIFVFILIFFRVYSSETAIPKIIRDIFNK